MAKRKIQTTVIAHDVHVPYQDHDAIRVFLSILKEINPSRVILLGDIYDCEQISRFGSPADRLTKIQEDINEGSGFVADCRRMAPQAHIDFQFGNHEERLYKWVSDKPEMAKIHGFEPVNFFGLSKIKNLSIIPYYEHLRILDTVLTHGHKVSRHAGATAISNLQAYGFSVMCGHTHRLARVCSSVGGKTLIGYEGGCLCDLNPSYMPVETANWQHGFSVTHEISGIPQLQVHQIQIIDGHAWFDGRLYSA